MASESTANASTVDIFSRRDLFRRAGLAAGGAMLLGLPKFLGGWTSEARAAIARNTSSIGSIALELNGTLVGHLTAASGGNAFADIVVEQVGPDMVLHKRPGQLKFEDIVLEVPINSNSKPFGTPITGMLSNNQAPANGAIVYGDLNNTEVKRLEFTNALLTEIALPACDASSAQAAGLTVRLTPQATHLVGATGKKLSSALGTKGKSALQSNFRLNVQGLESACSRISKVEHIIAKRTMGAPIGLQRTKQTAPLDCSPLSLFLPESDAGPFYAWFDDMVIKGNPGAERAGLLEWLDPTLTTVIASAQLGGLGIVRFAPEPVKAGTQTSGLVRVDMYCETINFTIL